MAGDLADVSDSGSDEGEEVDFKSERRISDKPAELSRRIARTGTRSDDEAHLAAYVKQRALADGSRSVVLGGLKKNRFCCVLDSADLQGILDGMQYLELGPGNELMRQGERGNHFFIVESGSLDMLVNGAVVDQMGPGDSTGGIALLYRTTRTATIIAKEKSGVWAVKGCAFQKALRDHAKRNFAANMEFLDRINLFDGLAPQRKQLLGKLALLTEVYEAGKVVLRRDMPPSAVYAVKSGRLFFRGKDGSKLSSLQPGDCFGWRAVLYDELESADVVVEERCELVGVGVKALKKVLGDDLGACLMDSFFQTALRHLHVFDFLHPKILRAVGARVQRVTLEAGEALDGSVIFAAVVDGSGEVRREGGLEVLTRGHRYVCPELGDIEGLFSGAAETAPASGGLTGLGCRLAALTCTGLAEALKEVGLSAGEADKSPLVYLKKLALVRKVPVFRELSDAQADGMVAAMDQVTVSAGKVVFAEGDAADKFYMIASGYVQVLIGGKEVRKLGAGACFGERALLLSEPRSATIKVAEADVGLWFISRETFRSVVSDTMREKLEQNMHTFGTNVTLKSLKHVRLIGVGGFGSVRLVEHRKTRTRYALKRIRKVNGEIPPEVIRECSLLAENAHPFLLQFVEKFVGENSIYILTELVTGGQLYQQVLDKMGVLSRKHAQFYIGSLSMTLEVLHAKRIVFRDLKPENVMLDHQGYIKLVDFGLAKRLDEEHPRAFSICGTPHYIAPEVVAGHGYATECDTWSLGVIMFELVCGNVPFGAEAEDVPSILASVMEDALTIPSRYNDSAGKKLITGLLTKTVEKRLGSGQTGWEEIKGHKFFKQNVTGNLFSQIAGREITAPLIPEGEEYINEEALREQASLSDAAELGHEEPMDIGCKLMHTFKKFDLNGDGSIDRYELGTVLGALDPKTFTSAAVDQLMSDIDKNGDGTLSFEEFVAWVLGGGISGESLGIAMKNIFKLDAHN